MESVSPEEESINTLASMLRAKYMTQRTEPEVVDRLNARRQMRGERLVEYAQSLREIGENGDVGEDWLVSAFLKVAHVGDYSEGYSVGLETAMARWDEREAQQGRGPLAAAAGGDEREQLGIDSESKSVVAGYGPAWGAPQKRPRYDTEGRQVTAGGAGSTEWWKSIPPGFQLVPVGKTGVTSDGTKFRTASSDQGGARGRRPGGDQHFRRPAKTLRVEAKYGGGQGTTGATNPAYATREARLQNLERYQARTKTQGRSASTVGARATSRGTAD
ncbi:hypothetical protein F441_09289 [Phytophthora nicotianae CJ01A1]|uniref:Retrotransposon gag domain-containing protein n=1 Tax=Phytophthora nicotianae CJ01A1 TaxID=1317063 RepID=W2WZU0_PHYNI|nr:hypothetical protein F441_09289 [Phytophthora nicotianae CJ01A1]